MDRDNIPQEPMTDNKTHDWQKIYSSRISMFLKLSQMWEGKFRIVCHENNRLRAKLSRKGLPPAPLGDTPETDAAEIEMESLPDSIGRRLKFKVVYSSVARSLERQRNALRAQLSNLKP